MTVALPFRNLEPTFAAGLIDDPLLLVRIRPTGGTLMFDCGQVHHLAKRIISRLDSLFISHAHMDHWMGIDSIIRHLHASSRTVEVYGPPGLADKFAHKLAGYDWNLAEDHWGSFRVNEVHVDSLRRHLFAGPDGFRRQPQDTVQRSARAAICRNPHCQVSAATCEHRVASLIYRIDERPDFSIDKHKLARLGLLPGPWLGELKRRVLTGEAAAAPLLVSRSNAAGQSDQVAVGDLQALLRQIERPQRAAAIGYVSDVGFSAVNRERILQLMAGVDLLVCECTFLADGKERARASHHLCSDDLNRLLAELRPAAVLPMHLSKTYSRRSAELYRQLIPPPGTQLLEVPLRRTCRPLLAAEMAWQRHDGAS